MWFCAFRACTLIKMTHRTILARSLNWCQCRWDDLENNTVWFKNVRNVILFEKCSIISKLRVQCLSQTSNSLDCTFNNQKKMQQRNCKTAAFQLRVLVINKRLSSGNNTLNLLSTFVEIVCLIVWHLQKPHYQKKSMQSRWVHCTFCHRRWFSETLVFCENSSAFQ